MTKLNGWRRLFILLTCCWTVFVGLVAVEEYRRQTKVTYAPVSLVPTPGPRIVRWRRRLDTQVYVLQIGSLWLLPPVGLYVLGLGSAWVLRGFRIDMHDPAHVARREKLHF